MISNSLYWGAISFMAVLFVATVILNSYLFMLDNQLTQEVYLSRIQANKARLIIQYDSKNKRVFEGDVIGGQLSLYDILVLSSRAGNLQVEFSKSPDGRVTLSKIENFANNEKHYWEMRLPNLNWSKSLNGSDVDLTRIFVNGGTTVHLIYR